jgi:hypothetical protein
LILKLIFLSRIGNYGGVIGCKFVKRAQQCVGTWDLVLRDIFERRAQMLLNIFGAIAAAKEDIEPRAK